MHKRSGAGSARYRNHAASSKPVSAQRTADSSCNDSRCMQDAHRFGRQRSNTDGAAAPGQSSIALSVVHEEPRQSAIELMQGVWGECNVGRTEKSIDGVTRHDIQAPAQDAVRRDRARTELSAAELEIDFQRLPTSEGRQPTSAGTKGADMRRHSARGFSRPTAPALKSLSVAGPPTHGLRIKAKHAPRAASGEVGFTP